MLSPADFRAVFPEFDISRYPDARVQFYLDLSYSSLNPQVWGQRLDAAAGLHTAHQLTLAGPTVSGGGSGGASSGPRLGTGLVASKSIGGVSVSYDNNAGQVDRGGAFNLTNYGKQFLTMLQSGVIGAYQL